MENLQYAYSLIAETSRRHHNDYSKAGKRTALKRPGEVHELSLVQGIMDAVKQEAADRGGSVKSFKVEVGELAQFDVRLVRRLIEDLKKGTPLAGTKVIVEKESSRVRCLGCGKTWTFADLAGPLSAEEREMVHFLPELLGSSSKCPACSKSFFEIEAGRSVRIAEVVLDV